MDVLLVDIRLSLKNLMADVPVFIIAASSDGAQSYYHRYEIVETAKQLDYFANIRAYHNWIKLIIDVGAPTVILISFHVPGHDYIGLLGCSACAYHKDNTDEGEGVMINDVQPLSDSLFQFSYADERNNLLERFQIWLEEVIVTGLDYWNKSL